MNTEPGLVRLEAVTKAYASAAEGGSVAVLKAVDLDLRHGESLAVVGPSGSGKSTLLNLIGTLDRPDQGRVWVDGQDVSGLDEIGLAAVRNRKIGFVFQSHHLLPQCTVLENVLIPTLAARDSALRDGATDRARQLIERVGLGPRMQYRPGRLSGGERQRVAVVRALINRPALLLADEPTGALDRVSAEALSQLLVELNQSDGVAMVVVTHAIELARKMSRQMMLSDGQLRPAGESDRRDRIE